MIDETVPHSPAGSAMVRRLGTRLRTATRRCYSTVKRMRAFGLSLIRYVASILSHLLPQSHFARIHRRRTFQAIYRNQEWGTDGDSRFFSGVGSHGGPAAAYVDAMIPVISAHLSECGDQPKIVDLGCGDFSVGARLIKRLPGLQYVGCDVVPEIVEHNRQRYGTSFVQFEDVDVVSEDLPDGDICLVRQVFQHLSNRDIACVLPKLRKYRFVYVTEAQPLERSGRPNPDKPANADVRFDWRAGCGRGVELDQPPWNLSLKELLRVSGTLGVKEVIITHQVRFSD